MKALILIVKLLTGETFEVPYSDPAACHRDAEALAEYVVSATCDTHQIEA